LIRRVGVHAPFPPLQPNAERTEPLLGEQPLRLAQRHRLGLRPAALGEIPQPLAAVPAGDGDVPAAAQQLEHLRHLTAPPPAMLAAASRRAVLELARREGAAFLELPEDVAAKGRVL